MRRRTSKLLSPAAVLSALVGLSGCAGNPFASAPSAPVTGALPPPSDATPLTPAGTPAAIAALLPLSGGNAALGASMLEAIRLALGASAGTLDIEDTASTPGGATKAAAAALAHHDAVILGPLTAPETQAASAVVTPAGIPILSFSSDTTAARPGVWVLGLTLTQQVNRLVAAAQAENRQHFAAFLPENATGNAMGAALSQAIPVADIRHHGSDFASINDGLKTLAGYDGRAGDRDRQIKADRLSTDPAVRAQADDLAKQPTPPPPFDALLLGDTGTQLGEVIQLLGPYDVHASDVRIMGPYLWSKFARKLGGLAGAWYAGPDPVARAGFAASFAGRYHVAPNSLDDIAYDSAALAAALAAHGGDFSVASLTRPDGFAGTDGVFVLDPDGQVRRAYAVFQIDAGGGAHIVSPAPNRLTAHEQGAGGA